MCLPLQRAWSPPRSAIDQDEPAIVHAEVVEAPREHSAVPMIGRCAKPIVEISYFRETGSADQMHLGAKADLERKLRASAVQQLLLFDSRGQPHAINSLLVTEFDGSRPVYGFC